jgi:dCTP deaminase
VNESDTFDFVEKDKEHKLYIEVTPISFDLEVKQGTALSQLRLFKGREQDISLTKEELFHEEDDAFPVLEGEKPYRDPCNNQSDDIWFPFRLDLDPDPIAGCSAFAAKKSDNLPPIDPDKTGPDKKGYYDPHVYWEPIRSKNDAILLEPDRLYIMRSKERLRIPAHLALECKSYTTQMGEWRIEYAGFAHPYFGRLRDDHKGAPIMFEVRGHNVPTILTDGIPLGNVRFLRMSQPAAKPDEKPNYEEQELTLSKCFKPWS